MITFGLDLNLIPGKVLPRLNVSQYDKGQTVSVSLWNGDVPYSIPTGYTAQVVGTKADKTGFMYNCTIAHGQPSFVITDQMTIFPGEVTLEVIILDTDKRIGTINFILDVERAALADDTQISESDMPIIQQIPEYANAAAASAEEAREWAEQARGVTSFNGREGAVTPANGDYTASQISSSAIAGQNNVESALTKINTDLTPKSGYVQTVSALTKDITYKTSVAGTFVRLHIGCSITESELPSNKVIATLPSNLRPSVGVSASWYNQEGSSRYIAIDANGNVMLYGHFSTDTYCAFDVTYLI